jgi:acyl carrier protein
MKTFNQIVTQILTIPEEKIADTLRPEDVEDWDSMNYLLFIAELEKEYNVSFTMDEVMNAKTLGDVRRALESK